MSVWYLSAVRVLVSVRIFSFHPKWQRLTRSREIYSANYCCSWFGPISGRRNEMQLYELACRLLTHLYHGLSIKHAWNERVFKRKRKLQLISHQLIYMYSAFEIWINKQSWNLDVFESASILFIVFFFFRLLIFGATNDQIYSSKNDVRSLEGERERRGRMLFRHIDSCGLFNLWWQIDALIWPQRQTQTRRNWDWNLMRSQLGTRNSRRRTDRRQSAYLVFLFQFRDACNFQA